VSFLPPSGTTPETELILSVLRRRVGAATESDAAGPIDEARLLTTAARHAVTPLVADGLDGASRPASLEAAARAARLRSLELAGELVDVLGRLGDAGIEALAYKGPVVAAGLYGDPAVREFVDLDLLVRPGDVRAALRVLESGGYLPWISVSDRQLAFLLRVGHDRKLVRDDRYVTEIQWAIAERSFGIPRGVEPLFARAREVAVGGREVRTLSRLDEVLILAVHGAAHLWGRLAWVMDMALALATVTDEEAAMLLRAADRARIRRLFLSSPAIVRAVLGGPIPAPLWEAVLRDAALIGVVERLAARLLGPEGPEHAVGRDAVRDRLALKDSPGQRLGEALRIVSTPTPSDWHLVALPDVLWPAYYPIRLARLFASYVIGNRTPGDWLRDEDED
jgi:hypothetical protein